jgi:hypothetical protein
MAPVYRRPISEGDHAISRKQRFTFTVGLDPKMEPANAYSVLALPTSFIVDRKGYLAALALGPRSWDNAASQALVEGLSRR